ncbi:MAG: hypothetical protein ACE5L6_00280 [Candidatus Bathyarchaeia archaeon]
MDDVELYFNASNGGEITEYYDVSVDPNRSRNLVNLGWKPYYNLLPLFSSLFYKPGYPDLVFSTGGDAGARLWLLGNTSEYVILQSSSRIVNRVGQVAKDVSGNAIYVNSTWIIHDNGLVSVERTFYVPRYVTIPPGWRWYPFYVTRRAGFTPNATFYMFNTTYGFSSVVNETTYKDIFSLFPILYGDTRDVFGVAFPFFNASLGGDGAHNILVAYKYDELVSVDEWRADNYHSNKNSVTEGGAVHEFSEAMQVSTHTYHAVLNFTHQPTDEESVQSFAGYYAENAEMALVMECSVTTNKDLYQPGDDYAFYGSGLAYYNLTELEARLTVKDGSNRLIYRQDYGPANIMAGQVFNLTLLEGTVGLDAVPGNYTVSLQISSPFGIVIASSSRMITVSES